MSTEKLPVPSFQDSSSTTQQHHVAIPIEELNASLEGAKVKNPVVTNDNDETDEEKGECRYCQEDELVSKLEAPCNCNGTLKYAHRKCVSLWCNIKRNTMCEICLKPFAPNYSVMGPPPINEEDEIPMSERWRIPGTNIRILTPLQLIEVGTNRLLRSMNSDFTLRNPTFGVIFGTALLLFLAMLIIRDACYYTPPNDDQFTQILYIAVVIIVAPIYILSWIMEFRAHLQRERERSERERDLSV